MVLLEGINRRLVGEEDALCQIASLLYGAAISELQLRMLLGFEEPSPSLIDERIQRTLAAFFPK